MTPRSLVRLAAAALGATALLAGCAAPDPGPQGSPAAAERVVTDMTGRQVILPATLDRIAQEWSAHTVIVEMLGAGKNLVAVNEGVKPPAMPLLQKVNPGIAALPAPFTNQAVNHEELLASDPDIVFASENSPTADSVAQQDMLPVVRLGFTTFPEMRAAIELTGNVLGGDAFGRAARYTAYLDEQIADVQARTAALPATDRPTVVHVVGVDASQGTLRVDGADTLIDTWITLAGGANAAADARGDGGNNNAVTIDLEQLAAWNPDVLIMQAPGTPPAELVGQPVWRDLAAVTGNRVYLNPAGVFPWDRYGPEAALQLQWAGQQLHPDLFSDLDIRAEAREFYRTFLSYELTDSELDSMLRVTE